MLEKKEKEKSEFRASGDRMLGSGRARVCVCCYGLSLAKRSSNSQQVPQEDSLK